jgi:hypothetical protein
MIAVLFKLLCGHMLCECSLQTDNMVWRKRPGYTRGLVPGLAPWSGPWWFWMGAHCLINAIPALVVGAPTWLAAAYAATHFIVDRLACHHKIGWATDQLLHGVCLIGVAIVCSTF